MAFNTVHHVSIYRRGCGGSNIYTTPNYSQIVDIEIVVSTNIVDTQQNGKRGVVQRVSVHNTTNVYIYDLYQEVAKDPLCLSPVHGPLPK